MRCDFNKSIIVYLYLYSHLAYLSGTLYLIASFPGHCIPLNLLSRFLCFYIWYLYLSNRYALAVKCSVIIHCLEVICKAEQITSVPRE